MDRVEDEATDILKEIIANPLLQKDASFVHSFVLYPTANARLYVLTPTFYMSVPNVLYRVLGNCKAQRGDICKKQNRMKKAQEHYERALHHFSEAMTWYPKDEEYSICKLFSIHKSSRSSSPSVQGVPNVHSTS